VYLAVYYFTTGATNINLSRYTETMQKSINRYKIGLAVIAVFTLGLAIYVAVQAGSAKQDNETYKAANEIATKLNDYTLYKAPPESLSAAGIRDVPETVKYTKVSNDKYKFCVTYKADSSGFDAANVQTDLLTAAYGDPYASSQSTYEQSYLVLDTNHHKGENCQTIKTYSSSYYGDPYSNGSGSGSSCKYTYSSDPTIDDKNYQAYTDCLDKESSSTSSSTKTSIN
jgi:hypothetical protein